MPRSTGRTKLVVATLLLAGAGGLFLKLAKFGPAPREATATVFDQPEDRGPATRPAADRKGASESRFAKAAPATLPAPSTPYRVQGVRESGADSARATAVRRADASPRTGRPPTHSRSGTSTEDLIK